MPVDHVKAARDAWERGYRILALLANWILASNRVRTRIKVDGDFRELFGGPKKPIKDLLVDEIRDEVLQELVRAYDELVVHLPQAMGIRLDRETIWRLGDWDVSEILDQVDLNRGTGMWRIRSLLTTVKDRPGWKAADWKTRFVPPMLANAKAWRERFAELAATTNTTEGAYSLGDCKYEVDEKAFRLSDERDTVLLELVRMRAATTEELVEASGKPHAVQTLHKILKSHPQLRPYIKMAGARGQGGYSTTIVAR